MYIILGIFIGLSVVGVAFAIYYGIEWYRARRHNREDLKRWDHQEKQYKEQIKELETQIHRQDLSDDRDVLNGQKNLILEDIEKTRGELNSVKVELNDTRSLLAWVRGELDKSNSALASCQETRLKTENVIHELEEKFNVLSRQRDDLEGKIKDLVKELNRLLNLQKVINNNENGVVWNPILNEKEVKLISLLQELSSLYPDLKTDFATIEWKKIWLPQLQNLGSILETKRGIYRLILKKNKPIPPIMVERDGKIIELPVCYVGQAVDIKDRWYQHVKKMVGVMPKGNEKVYNWRPEDFYWCIVESGNGVNLNESERYWIEYYCAKEGLNKKA